MGLCVSVSTLFRGQDMYEYRGYFIV